MRPASNRTILRPAASAALAVAAAAATLVPAPEPIRLVATWSFLAIGPGLALVGTSGLGGPLTVSMFALALSLTVDGLVACLLLYAGAWSPSRGLGLLIGLSLAASWLRIWRLSRASTLDQPPGQALADPGRPAPGRTSALIALSALAILAVLVLSRALGADPEAVVGVGSAVLLIALLSEEELASAAGRRRAGSAEWTRHLALALLLATFLVVVTLRSVRLLQLGRPGGPRPASELTATPPPPPGLTTPTP